MTRALPIAFALATLPASGQGWHTPIPTPNIVAAGYNLEGAAHDRKAALYVLLIGGGMTAILSQADGTKGTAAPWVAGVATFGIHVSLNLKGLRWEDRAGDLLQCGYSPDRLWETVPDSVGMDPPRKYQLPAMIDGNKVRLPGRFK